MDKSTLYTHIPRPHKARNVNIIHKEEQSQGGLNARLAVWLTNNVGTMICAYIFAFIGINSLFGAVTGNLLLSATFGAFSSYFLQLVLLPALAVGQGVLGRHSELQADEAFKTTMSTYHDIEQIMQHLSAQDAELLRQAKMLVHLLEKNGISLQELEAEGAAPAPVAAPSSQPQTPADAAAPAEKQQ
jgi:ribosomal protein L12E/L44/L45/RPP1/RPP2